jgi:hypothetical protein
MNDYLRCYAYECPYNLNKQCSISIHAKYIDEKGKCQAFKDFKDGKLQKPYYYNE